jgi:hypothetical protein
VNLLEFALTVVPANEGSWDDLQAIFGTRGEASRCQCQWFKVRGCDWASLSVDERAEVAGADRVWLGGRFDLGVGGVFGR